MSKIGVVIHNRMPNRIVLDSTPMVCDLDFCTKAGFVNRRCCPLGQEGSPARVACELTMLGIDPTDGIPGPHWIFQGSGSIWKKDGNPFLAVVSFPDGGGGLATVCNNRRPVVCNGIRVP